MAAEATQEQGRRAVGRVKRWLEATTWIELPWDVYAHTRYCELSLPNGSVKRMDLRGLFLTDARTEIFVESKDYGSAGNQNAHFLEFLAAAYGYTHKCLTEKSDPEAEFIFVTTHPFSQTSWTDLVSPGTFSTALGKHAGFLGGMPVNEALVAKMVNRIWLLVMNEKQERLVLTASELSLVHSILKRKESGL